MKKVKVYIDSDGTLFHWQYEKSFDEVCRPGYFNSLEPFETVCTAVKRLVDRGFEVSILSACPPYEHSEADKKESWSRYVPFIKEQIIVPYGEDKSSYISHNDDTLCVLVDDYTRNLNEWTRKKNHVGIKLRNDLNGTKGTWTGYSVDYRQHPDVIANTIFGIIQMEAAM